MSHTITIIEDDTTIRSSLKQFIEAKSTHEVVQIYESIEAYELARSSATALMLLDIGLPGKSGIEGIPVIKEAWPDVNIIMLTTYEEQDVIFRALCAGACSYISKRTSLAKIVEALHIVADGGSYMSPSIARKVTHFFAKQPKRKKTHLSDRQQEIVTLIVKGCTYQQVAEQCYISLNTVRTHIKKIYEVLQINSKVALITKWNAGEI